MRSILISLALVMVLPAAPGAPASPPVARGGPIPGTSADEAIVYGSTEGGRREIRLMLAGTGADLGSMTPAGARDVEPAWGPDGATIAFARKPAGALTHTIHVVQAEGGGTARVTSGASDDRQPAWSPSGKLAFVRADPIRGTSQIMSVNQNGSGLAQVTARGPSNRLDASPSWSPDGSMIAFVRAEGDLPALSLIGADGQGYREIASDPGCADANPSWSEGGIVFDRACGGGPPDLYLAQPAGETWSVDPLTTTPGTAEFDPDWSSDAGAIVFSTHPAASGGADLAWTQPVLGAPAPVLPATAGGTSELGADWHHFERPGGQGCEEFGTTGPDPIARGPGDEVICGLDGDDVIDGGLGDDVLRGGGGTDTASYASSGSGVQASLAEDAATGAGTDTLSGIENLTGSPGHDSLTGDDGPNVLTGGAGNDTLTGGGGTDTASYAASSAPVQANLDTGTATGEGADSLDGIENLIGSSGVDNLTGSDAANRLEGGGGHDTLDGGPGHDLLLGGDGDDDMVGGDGDDRLLGEAGEDQLTGGEGHDDLEGGSAADVMTGGPGNDDLAGGGGNDTSEGGSGGDRLQGDGGDDHLVGASGRDRIYGGAGEDRLLGDGGADVLSGEDGQDRLTGGSGPDRLSGGAGNDRLTARDRTRDRVNGGSGKDRGSIDRGRDAVAGLESAKRSRRFRSRSTKVASGIVLTKIRDRRGPRRIFVLSVAPGGGRRTDTALAGNVLKGFERTSSMAKRHGAIAGVNGDFGLPSGRPAHHFSMDGDLKQTSEAYGYHFAMSADGARTFMGHRSVALDSLLTQRGERWDVAGWNDGAPGTGEIAGVAGTSGGLENPPKNACSVRLTPVQAQTMRWSEDGSGVESDHTVEAVSCGAQSISGQGGIVLSARLSGEEGAFLRGLAPNNALTLSWSMGWAGVLDALGGYPQLIRAGKVVAGGCAASLCKRHPRTGVGMRPDGTVMLVVVDGRRKRWSKGMTLKQFARQFERLGAEWALNLDGGGSSTMWIRGKGIVNRPSDRRERSVSSALLVLTGPDGGEPALTSAGGQGQPAPRAPTEALDQDTGGLAAVDPGSTGGLLEALAEGVFDPPQVFTGELRQALVRFRTSLGD